MPPAPEPHMLGAGLAIVVGLLALVGVLLRRRQSSLAEQVAEAPPALPAAAERPSGTCRLCDDIATVPMPRSGDVGFWYALGAFFGYHDPPLALCERDAQTYRGLLEIDIRKVEAKAAEQRAERDRWLAEREHGGILAEAKTLRQGRKPASSSSDLTEGIV